MRIGLDYRILGVGRSAATRGMPRFTQQQLREVLLTGTDHEFELLCDSRTDQSLFLPEIRNAANVHISFIPEAATVDVHSDDAMLAKAEIFESWLLGRDLDLYHATTPFYLDQLIVTQLACPVVATVYDLIPLVYPSQYLVTPKLHQLYTLAATMVSRATRLLAISQAARSDAIRYLGVPEDRIDLTSPIAEPFFRPMPQTEVQAALASLRSRLPITEEFVLSVSDLHFTKNLETLLRGYSLLPATVRAGLPLVVACHLSREHEKYLAGVATKLGVEGQVVTTGLVTDEELAALYNAALLVVHPSRYEGFGLPVLEAMQCGTPVIAASCSSVPEVTGDAAILVDPDDAPGFAGAMQLIAEDDALREEMRCRGLKRAKRYSGPDLARATLAGYAAAVAAARSPSSSEPRPLRVAMWTPLPPLETGVAAYSTELLGALALRCDVELFVDDGYLPTLDVLTTHPVRHFRAFGGLAETYDVVIYQLGASVFHLYMQEAVLCHPGVVVLHDLVWSHLVHHRFLEGEDREGFRSELQRLEGEVALAEYDRLTAGTTRDTGERGANVEQVRRFLDRYLMLREIVSTSQAQIVHFPAAVEELTCRFSDAFAFYVPMGVSESLGGRLRGRPELRKRRARARLSIPPSTFVVGLFGLVDGVKQVEAAVRALAQLVRVRPDSLLLVTGAIIDQDYADGLIDIARAEGVMDAICLTGHLAAEDFDDHLAAVDVVVNLRHPSKMQMSATVLRAAAAAKPVVLSALPEWDFIPGTFCRRVAVGNVASTGMALAAELIDLAGDPALRAELSAAATAYHQDEATTSRMAAAYFEVLEKVTGRALAGSSATGWAETPSSRETVPAPRSLSDVNLNKACEIEDFADPDLAAVMADVFSYKLAYLTPDYPRGAEYRKDWEVAMAVRALRDCGALRADAVILGVGAGSEDTNFYLTRHVSRVIATDRYLSPGAWGAVAPASMLVDPLSMAPYAFDRSRLVVQHMDGRNLCFDDDTFDGIFSSGSIEHFGDLEDIASAAYEMGRVLKPGGVLSLSTELLLSGPPGGKGMPGTVLFSPADLRRYVIDASGLETVDDLQLTVSQSTLASQRDLAHAIRARQKRVGGDHGPGQQWPGDSGLDLPHLVMVADGYVFGSVHLALRKGDRYPVVPNAWARPSEAILRSVAEDNQRIIAFDGRTASGVTQPGNGRADIESEPARPPLPTSWEALETLALDLTMESVARRDAAVEATSQLLELHSAVDKSIADLRGGEEEAASMASDIDQALEVLIDLPLEELAHDANVSGSAQPPSWSHGAGWRWCPIELPNGLGFGVMVNPEMKDDITTTILNGGVGLDWNTVMLMLDIVEPGDLVLDLGAYLGTFTLAAAAAGCRVVAFEASPSNAALLRASVSRNGFPDVHIVNAAVGDAPGEVRFFAEGPYGFVEFRDPNLEGSDLVVPAITVDSLLEELDITSAALVKMDIEGSEIRALAGMTRLLEGDSAPPLLLESNGHTLQFYGARPLDLLQEVAKLGYESYLIDDRRLVRVPPGQVQLQTVVDYLAVKGSIEEFGGWPVEEGLSIDERISRVLEECAGSSVYTQGHRAFIAHALAEAEPELQRRSEVQALLAELREDPVERVRSAAAWSAALPT